jgi:hypothetical protein
MKTFKIGVVETPYKELAFILAKGDESLITESKAFDIDLYFTGEIEGDDLVFSWDANDTEHSFSFKIEIECENVLRQPCYDPNDDDTIERTIKSVSFGNLEYFDEKSIIKDLGEVGKEIWNHAEYKLDNNLI